MTRFCARLTRRIVLCAAAYSFFLSTHAHAVTTSWNTNSSGNFTTAANWDNGVPDSDDTAVFNRGFVAYEVNFPGGSIFDPPPNYLVDSLRVRTNEVSFVYTDLPFLTIPSITALDPDLSIVVGENSGDVSILNMTLNSLSGVNAIIARNAGSNGTLNVGGLLNLSGTLRVGDFGTGVLNVIAGGRVQDAFGQISGWTDSIGVATVSGAGSQWSNSIQLGVGSIVGSSGSLIVESGGNVFSASGYLGRGAGSSGAATITGTGSSWISSNVLRVGELGTGQLTISAGGSVSNTEGFIGYESGSSGTVTVTGPGSTWTNSGGLYVGHYDKGSLTIQNGGTVSNTFGRVGWSTRVSSSGLTSSATITGAGSTWTNSDDRVIGGYSKGTMTISDGGSASNTSGFIGFGAAPSSEVPDVLLVGNGAVTVTGPGSTWTNNGELNVGHQGTGTLTVDGGGDVSSTHGFIGRYADLTHPNPAYRWSSTGTATVTGAGSSWIMSGRLSMGGDATTGVDGGTGTLTISSGGEASVAQDTALFPGSLLKLEGGSFATTSFGFQGGQFQWSSGTLHIDSYNGSLTNPAGGTLAPGRSAGSTMIAGSYTQQSGAALEIEIGGTALAMHDFVNATGTVLLGGELQLKLIDDFTPAAADAFTVLNTPGGIAGMFSNVTTGQRLLTVDGGGSFLVHYGATSPFNPNQIVLTAFEASPPLLPGDYNQNGTVDAADYAVWRENEGTTNMLPNDPIGGKIGQLQYDNWRAHFGQSAGSGGANLVPLAAASAAVPEPSSFCLFWCAAISVLVIRRIHSRDKLTARATFYR